MMRLKIMVRQKWKPEIILLYCRNCVIKNANIITDFQKIAGFVIKLKMLPCSSKIQVPHVLRILEQGTDGVEIIACPEESCEFLVGSKKAEKRIEYIQKLLDEIQIGSERVGISRGTCLSTNELIKLALKRAKAVKKLGCNPMKKGENNDFCRTETH